MAITAAQPPRADQEDPYAAVRAVADAVLYEGYLLYPYRASSVKNQVRWQFGVLAPQDWVEDRRIPDPGVAGSAESWFQQVECLAESPNDAHLDIRLRFLQLQHRQVTQTGVDGTQRPVQSLDADGTSYLSAEEALPQEFAVELPLHALLSGEQRVAVEAAADSTSEPISECTGRVIGRIVRTSEPLAAVIRASAQPAEAPFRLYRLRIGIENTALPGTRDLPRDMALRRSLIAAHVIVRLSAGRFLSLLDPPAWAVSAAAQCVNRHVFPVLAGREDRTDTVLCSPIILYDHPRVAPESPGDLHDATEIDEILTLRTLTLTEAEKVQARATDPRAAAIVDRINAMPPEVLARLHGAIRALRPLATEDVTDEVPWWDPRADSAMQPETDAVVIAGVTVCRGSRVRLRPRRRGTDIQDIFLTGRTALVQKVLHDVDGSIHVAVVLDEAVDLAERRSLHFSPDELEPVSGDTP